MESILNNGGFMIALGTFALGMTFVLAKAIGALWRKVRRRWADYHIAHWTVIKQ